MKQLIKIISILSFMLIFSGITYGVGLVKVDPPMNMEAYQVSVTSYVPVTIISELNRNQFDLIITNDTGYDIYLTSYTVTRSITNITYVSGNSYILKTSRSLTLENLGKIYATLKEGISAAKISIIKQIR